MDDQTIQQLIEGDYQPVGHSSTCPNCYSGKTLFLASIQMWFCLDCGIEFDITIYYDVQAYEADERISKELLEYIGEER